MADWHAPQGPFDIPEVPNFLPRRLKPWLFIFFVLIVQFSGGLYLAAASDMVGTTALMQEDILMAGYASLVGMAINFAVMFRIKFRFSTRTQLLAAAIVLLGLVCVAINLWRATFLHHPYISFRAMKNRNVIRATGIYMVFFTLLATEHVFEHSYAATILGFDETNLIDLNWYVFAGIIVGCALIYFTFALRRWRYKTMTAIGFALAAVYLAYFYFLIDYGVEKEMLFIPLFFRGMASVVISIIFLTSIVQSGLPFQVFPQALTINGFTGAVMSATFGPAVIG